MASEFPSGFLHTSNGTRGGLFLSNGFFLATLPYRPYLWSAWDIVVTCTLWQVFAIKGMYLLQSYHLPLGGLSDQSLSGLVIQFGGTAWSRQGLGGTIPLPYLNACLDCAPKDIQELWNIFVSIPWSVPFHNFCSWNLVWNALPSKGNLEEQLILFWNNHNHYNLTQVEAN